MPNEIPRTNGQGSKKTLFWFLTDFDPPNSQSLAHSAFQLFDLSDPFSDCKPHQQAQKRSLMGPKPKGGRFCKNTKYKRKKTKSEIPSTVPIKKGDF